MQQDAGIALQTLRADGGASANSFLMQFQADICHVPVTRPACVETTAMGAAFLAGLAVGFWTDLSDIKRTVTAECTFQPKMDSAQRMKKLAGWEKAVSRCRDWANASYNTQERTDDN